MSAPIIAERLPSGKVVVSDSTGTGFSRVLTATEARTLATALLVAASSDASKAAGHVGDAIEIAQTGRDLFTRVKRVVKKNGWA